MLTKERKRLREVDAFTIVDYVKTSIEILMNMRMEEYEGDKESKGGGKSHKRKPSNQKTTGANSANQISDTESVRSLDEPPKDYE
jgi:hypothetical protein